MKTLKNLLITILFGGAVLLNIARADSRDINITTADGRHVEFSFGQIKVHSTLVGRPAGGWTLLPFSVSSPTPIDSSHNFDASKSFTTTSSTLLSSDINKIRFDMVISTDDTSLSSSSYTTAMTASVEVVDSSTNTVLGTLFSISDFTGAHWHSDMGNGPSDIDNVPSSAVGHTVYLRMNVQWDTSIGQGWFNGYTTSGSEAFSWIDMRPPIFSQGGTGKGISASNVIASNVNMCAAPNPVVDVTTIHLQGVSSAVSLKIYDMIGREVADLTSALSATNEMNISYSATALRSGMYIIRLVTTEGTLQNQMIVKH